eukprot:9489818-Pyramimonas_sp.AAC.5
MINFSPNVTDLSELPDIQTEQRHATSKGKGVVSAQPHTKRGANPAKRAKVRVECTIQAFSHTRNSRLHSQPGGRKHAKKDHVENPDYEWEIEFIAPPPPSRGTLLLQKTELLLASLRAKEEVPPSPPPPVDENILDMMPDESDSTEREGKPPKPPKMDTMPDASYWLSLSR